MYNLKDKEIVLGNIVTAVNKLEKCQDFALLIPEVRVNLVYALPEAKTRRDVAAIEGRITAVCGFPRASGYPAFGASDHMARLIIEARKYDKIINAGINFKCDKTSTEIAIEYCKMHNLLFGWIDRSKEPAAIIEQDGTSMPWKIKQLVSSSGGLPRLFYEGDGWGKEPLFVALGEDAVRVTDIAIDIAKSYRNKLAA
jgi:hydroxymethylpyrimidine/phosphomethylpyrimidine kinase